MIGVSALAIIGFVITEFFVPEPIVPMTLFKNRTFTLAVIASISIGVAMFATSVFLAQYFQLARGASPTESGLMTIPMIVGQMGASIVIGALISKFGKWKRFMLLGSLLVVVGSYLMTTLSYDTDYLWVSVYMVVLGAGLGMVMQNLTLVVQNDTPASQLGAASSNVNFFRTIAGTIGVTIMGSLLATQVGTHITSGLKSYTPTSPEDVEALKGLAGGGIPHVSELPDGIRVIIENAYGNGIADVFWIAVPLAVLSVIAIAFLPNKALSTKTSAEQLKEEFEQVAIDLAEAEIGSPVTSSIQMVDEDAEAERAAKRDGRAPSRAEGADEHTPAASESAR
jgi:MFS family permease